MSEALIVWEPIKSLPRKTQKLIHGGLQVGAATSIVGALIAVFNYHNNNKITNGYSLHSWCGLTVATAVFLQWVVGAAFFLIPSCNEERKARVLYYHRFWGFVIYALGLATCCMGLLEKLTFLEVLAKLPQWSPTAIVTNATGISIVMTGMAVMYFAYRRHAGETSKKDVEPVNSYFS